MPFMRSKSRRNASTVETVDVTDYIDRWTIKPMQEKDWSKTPAEMGQTQQSNCGFLYSVIAGLTAILIWRILPKKSIPKGGE